MTEIWLAEAEAYGCSWQAVGATKAEAKKRLVRATEDAVRRDPIALHRPYDGRGVEAFDDYFGIRTLNLSAGTVFCDGSVQVPR